MRHAASNNGGWSGRIRRRFRPGLLELEDRRLPSTLTVTSTADDGSAGTLRSQVLQAGVLGGSNTIVFESSVFDVPQTVVLTQGEVPVISGTLTIVGPGAGLLTIESNGSDRLFQVFSGTSATISGLTLAGGSSGSGGGLDVQGKATLTNCTVTGNAGTNGGAIYNDGTLTMTGCTLSGNSAEYGGGLWNSGTATVNDCTINGNTAYMGGGLLNYKYGHANLTDCTVSGNSADLGGGLSNYGAANLTACTVSGNVAANTTTGPARLPAGGIYNYSNQYGGKVTIVDTIVAGNLTSTGAANDIGGNNFISVVGSDDLIGTGGPGGIINNLSGNIVLTNLAGLDLSPLGDYGGPTQTMALLSGSLAIGTGAAADDAGTTTAITADQRGFALDSPIDIGAFQAVEVPLLVSVATDGVGAPLGQMDLRGAVDLADLWSTTATITFSAPAFASAQTVDLVDGPLVLTDTGGPVTMSAPPAGLTIAGSGTAGVFQVGSGVSASLSGLTVSGGSAVNGGGLYNQGITTLTDCSIVGNSASADGGGVANLGTLSLVECTVSGNTASNGGGLYNDAQASLTACTVVGNTAISGGGLYNGAGGASAATLGDTVVAGNSGRGGSASDVGGQGAADVTGTFNLVGSGGSGGIAGGTSGNIVLAGTAGPGLSALGNYGGTMPTIALLPGSPAIAAGSISLLPAGVNTDQRGEPRVVGGTVDIGAFESQGFTLALVAGSTPQRAAVGTSFPDPLAVTVTANNPAEPVAGGTVTFTVNPDDGASATLSTGTATVGATGSAQVTATANLTAGGETVTAAVGPASVSIALTNVGEFAFSGLANQSVVYGTASVTFSGTVSDGAEVPVGEDIAVTFDGTTQDATVASDGTFSTTFDDISALGVAGSPDTVDYVYSGDADFSPLSQTTTLAITPAPPTVDVSDAGGTYSGAPFAATATVAGINGPSGSSLEGVDVSLSYYLGTEVSGAPISGVPTTADTYTVLATFAGSTDYLAQSAEATFTITRAAPTLTWNAPASIAYGTAMGPAQLDTTANVPGSFAYTPAAGTVLATGTDSLSVTFTPTDATDYTTATATTSVTIVRATPAITWNAPASVTYGTALGPAQLDATANVAGTFAYTPAAATVLTAGTQTLSVTFTPADTNDYTTTTATATITVSQVTPSVTWDAPASITYGTATGSAQLDATSSVAGTFAYTPAAGTVLTAGTHSLSVTFTPTDTIDYTTATAMTSVTVAQATPSVTWNNPATVTYGTTMGPAQLDATADVPGTFAYNPDTGTVLGAGTYTLSVTFTPIDGADYTSVTKTTTIVVSPAVPSITWNAPASITYGTALGSAQLDATTSVAGSFAYNPTAGTVLGAGPHTLSVTFTPSDTNDYTPATATTSVTVAQATPPVTWNAPASITYGTAMGPAQLDATSSVAGTFAYTPAAGTVLTAGPHTLSVTFTPTDTTDDSSVTTTTSINVAQATSAVLWITPASITYGTALGTAQLDATANVPGTFAYTPSTGTVLGAGPHTLSVTFTPTDTTDYTTAATTTSVTVAQATPSITWNAPDAVTYGTALGSAQLDATSSVAGTFAYTPAAGTVLTAGTDTLSVTFIPNDTTDYTTATASTTITIAPAEPAIAWNAPASVTYGTAMGSAQLDATANVPGTFSYTPAAGTVPGAGSPTLSVTFTPTDGTDYASATASVTLVVTTAAPSVNVSDGGVYDAAPMLATATVAGVVAGVDTTPAPSLENVSLELSYYAGGTATGTPMSGPPTTAGTYTVVATFPGSADYAEAAAQSTFTVTPAAPIVTWPAPASITYGTALGPAQLDATTGIPGSFSYNPGAGTVLTGGTHVLSVTFTPTDSTDYQTETATTPVTVMPAAPIVTWPAPAAIFDGTALGAAELDATANVAGTFVYDPAAGTVLPVGPRTLSATFTPTDTTDYTTVTATTTILVAMIEPSVTWPAPASITYGTALTGAQLDATTSVAGRFAYTPAAGTVLGAGVQTLSVTFTPDDTTDYASVTTTTPITVMQAEPAITWNPPSSLTYGAALGASQLDAAASTAGSFSYNPAPGTVLDAGSHTLSVTFTPDDATDYESATATATINVARATPAITWNPAASLVYGTAIGPSQLDATASTAGTWAYNLAAGTILGAGSHTLSVTFTPSDSTDYASATATATINVAQATPTVTVSDPGGLYSGSPFAATAVVSGVGGASGASLEGVNPILSYDEGSTALSGPPTSVGTYAVVAVFPGSADYASASSAPVPFTIAAGTPSVAIATSAGSTVFGQSVTLTATVSANDSGTDPPAGTITFLDGSTTLAVVSLDASAQAVLTVDSLALGGHSITAVYSGDGVMASGQSASMAESVAPADTQIVLVPHAVAKRKKVISLSLTAEVAPLAPGGGVPDGVVTFKIKKKTLGTATLSGGQATLTLKPNKVLNQSITITYSGVAEYQSASLATPKLTSRSLVTSARPAIQKTLVHPAARRALHSSRSPVVDDKWAEPTGR